MPLTPITDVGTAIVAGIAAAFATLFSALPAILAAAIILVIGWIVAGWVGGLLARGLRIVRFDRLADRSGVTTFLERSEIHADPAGVVGGIVTWYVLAFHTGMKSASGASPSSPRTSNAADFCSSMR